MDKWINARHFWFSSEYVLLVCLLSLELSSLLFPFFDLHLPLVDIFNPERGQKSRLFGPPTTFCPCKPLWFGSATDYLILKLLFFNFKKVLSLNSMCEDSVQGLRTHHHLHPKFKSAPQIKIWDADIKA